MRGTLSAAVIALVLAFLVSYAVDEPLRRYVEGQMNARLKGYTVSIQALDFHPIGLSVTLRELVFVQEASPDPPVARIPRLDASVQWKALLSGRLVADFELTRPALHLDLNHLRRVAEDPEPVARKGWQEAFEAIYPLKINEFTIVDGDVTYVDSGPLPPLRVSRVNLSADNIRNIRSRARDYPSAVHLDAAIFDSGSLVVDGHADFLATPHLGIKAMVAMEGVALHPFEAITNRYGIVVRNGSLSATGLVEYAPWLKVVDLHEATIRDVSIEYVHTPRRKGIVQEATVQTARAAREASNDPGLVLRARHLRVVRSTVGFVNRAVTPAYRAFLSDLDLSIENFSNHLTDGATAARLRGKFMGSGATTATATFRPERSGPDFDLALRLENTDLRAMNDMLRAYGKFDVVAGRFSLFSELRVKDRRVDGYVKPLFSGLDVYDSRQDRGKSLPRKLYEKAVEGVSKLLRNPPRREVATVATIAGSVENAGANTVEAILGLVQNAFFKAILPGFEREAAGRRT